MAAARAVPVALHEIPAIAVAIVAAMIGMRMAGFDNHDTMPMRNAARKAHAHAGEQHQARQQEFGVEDGFHDFPRS